MARFENALADNPAPRRLGDIVLRYESSMLIGETPRARRSAKPTVAWAMGLSALVATLGTFVARAPIGLTALLLWEPSDSRWRPASRSSSGAPGASS